jgi:very-short-patch-repair endonuclease
VSGIATSIEITLTQCLRRLPYVEALVVADSALRHDVSPSTLRRVAASVQGPGSPQVRLVVKRADPDSANGFESALRGISHGVPGLHLQTQRTIASPRQTARPDLVDDDLGIVVEADSFEWHGDRAALAKDARRYNLLLCDGWLVLRFAWEDVMFDPDYVRQVLAAIVSIAQRPDRSARSPVARRLTHRAGTTSVRPATP